MQKCIRILPLFKSRVTNAPSWRAAASKTVRMIFTSVCAASPFSYLATTILLDGTILCALAAELRLFQSVATLQRQG